MKTFYYGIIASLMIAVPLLTSAQNPYESLGIKTKVLTLSNGKYQEFFPNDTIVPIGGVLLNTITGKIIAFTEHDTIYSEYSLEPEVVSRFLSLDPLAADFPEWSPYNYTFNNPIRFTDPDGLAPEDIIVRYGKDCNCIDQFLATINANFEGQINASIEQVKDADGNIIDGVGRLVVDAIGDPANLSDAAKAFKEVTDFADRLSKDVEIDLSYGSPDTQIATGNFNKQAVDVADVQQWPLLDASTTEQDGPTQAGKLAHEIHEQTLKQAFGDNFNAAHQSGIGVENRVNGNTRLSDLKSGKGVVQRFKKSDGTVNSYQVDFRGRKVIKVRKTK